MSKPVDVVAVLRSSLRVIPGWQRLTVTKLEADAAIDAVAELIAAAKRGQELIESGAIRARESEHDAVAEWADMLDAALAACKPTGAEK